MGGDSIDLAHGFLVIHTEIKEQLYSSRRFKLMGKGKRFGVACYKQLLYIKVKKTRVVREHSPENGRI